MILLIITCHFQHFWSFSFYFKQKTFFVCFFGKKKHKKKKEMIYVKAAGILGIQRQKDLRFHTILIATSWMKNFVASDEWNCSFSTFLCPICYFDWFNRLHIISLKKLPDCSMFRWFRWRSKNRPRNWICWVETNLPASGHWQSEQVSVTTVYYWFDILVEIQPCFCTETEKKTQLFRWQPVFKRKPLFTFKNVQLFWLCN